MSANSQVKSDAAAVSVSPSASSKYITWPSFIAGCVSAATSKTVTAPLSRLTILMQIHSIPVAASLTEKAAESNLCYLPKAKYLDSSSPFFTSRQSFKVTRSLMRLVQTDGVLSLWKGNLMSVLHKFPYGGINYFTYEFSKVHLRPVWRSETDPGLFVRFTCGFMGGSVASLLTYPMDLMRTRLASHIGTQQRWAIWSTFAQIAKSEGFSALFKGVWLTMGCQGLNLAINFAIYEGLQHRFVDRDISEKKPTNQPLYVGIYRSLICGGTSGVAASLVVFPLDLARRRQQAFKGPGSLRAREIFKSIAATEGIRGLYRGLQPELIKVAPAVALNFFVYDLVRNYLSGNGSASSLAPR